MPPQFIFDYSQFDFEHPIYGMEEIRSLNPHRGDMEHINGVVLADNVTGRICAFKDVHDKEFWVPGHIPGRPILPGVIMIEAAAQMCAFYMAKFNDWGGFIGFGGAEDIKFRQQVVPGQRLIILGQKMWERHSRFGCKCQGIVNGALAFEATIIGTNLG